MITDKRFEYIKDKTKAFPTARLQELNTLLSILLKNDIPIAEFKFFVVRLKEKILNYVSPRQIQWNKIAPPCPKCGKRFDLYAINIPQGPKNKYGYRSHWICSNKKCLNEKYETKLFVDLFKNQERRYNKRLREEQHG